MGGSQEWMSDKEFIGLDETDLACMAHSLIQCANSGYKNEGFAKAKELVSAISAKTVIDDAMSSSRNNK